MRTEAISSHHLIRDGMAIWRKEEDREKGKTVFHCDEHEYHASDPADLESHMKVHGLHAGSFWQRKHDHEHGLTVYTCGEHGFSTRNPLEIEEHERTHALRTGLYWGFR